MTGYDELIQKLCISLEVPHEPDSDFFVFETQGHQAVVSAFTGPSGDEGVRVQISAGTFPQATDGSTLDALRMLHHLNHKARTSMAWRIVLCDDDVLMIQQTCPLTVGDEGLQQVLIDGLDRVGHLRSLLEDWLPTPSAIELPPVAGPSGHIVFA
jgi:hypothetical protein